MLRVLQKQMLLLQLPRPLRQVQGLLQLVYAVLQVPAMLEGVQALRQVLRRAQQVVRVQGAYGLPQQLQRPVLLL